MSTALMAASRQANQVAVYEGAPPPLTPSAIRAQVNLIQEVMRDVMKKDEHYGVIPGTTGKPSLLKPGAEKLIMTFRLVPDVQTEVVDLGAGHREYRVKVRLSTQNGMVLGDGVGSCTTMEGRYRYRAAPGKLTDKPVPREYWDLKKEDPARAQQLIGGRGFSVRKGDAGLWMIAQQAGDKVEHDNPADYYNTCWKVAKKRATVDAVLTVTAASDIFTQDLEDTPHVDQPAADAPPPPVSTPSATPVVPPIRPPPKREEPPPLDEEQVHSQHLSPWARHFVGDFANVSHDGWRKFITTALAEAPTLADVGIVTAQPSVADAIERAPFREDLKRAIQQALDRFTPAAPGGDWGAPPSAARWNADTELVGPEDEPEA